MIIFGVSWLNNKKVLRLVSPSWNYYFPDVDLNLVLRSGHSPYQDFFMMLGDIIVNEPNEKVLHKALEEAFATMKEENKELLDAIKRDQLRK